MARRRRRQILDYLQILLAVALIALAGHHLTVGALWRGYGLLIIGGLVIVGKFWQWWLLTQRPRAAVVLGTHNIAGVPAGYVGYQDDPHDLIAGRDRAPIQGSTTDAETRAISLFESMLTPEQLADWRKSRMVHVPLKSGGYAIIGDSHRITWSDRPNMAQCVHPVSDHETGILPGGDTLVAQLLWLRNDPNHLRKIGGLPMLPMPRPRPAAVFIPPRMVTR